MQDNVTGKQSTPLGTLLHWGMCMENALSQAGMQELSISILGLQNHPSLAELDELDSPSLPAESAVS